MADIILQISGSLGWHIATRELIFKGKLMDAERL
jgi:hypothetical protein